MKRFVAVLLFTLFLMGFVSCKEEVEEKENVYQIYYLSTSETRVETRDYKMQSVNKYDQLKELLLPMSFKCWMLKSEGALSFSMWIRHMKISLPLLKF